MNNYNGFKAVLFSTIFLCSAFTGLQAQEGIAHTIHKVTIEGRRELAATIANPNVAGQHKAIAIIRLGELSKFLPTHKDVKPEELYSPILGALKQKGKDNDTGVMKKAACTALLYFANREGSNNLVGPLGNVVKNQKEHFAVRKAAAYSLGRYYKDAPAATVQLTEALRGELATGPKGNNVSFVHVLIDSLGRLGNKGSLATLLSVFKSQFPTPVKRAAQKALENIDWSK